MTAHTDWSTLPTGLEPLAPGVGAFPHRPFLEAAWRYADDPNAVLHIESSTTGAAAIVASNGVIGFAGESNLTDYHTPLGPAGAEALVVALQRFSNMSFRLDSLPAEAVAPISAALSSAKVAATISEHGATAVLELPPTFDEWLASIGKKQRHEVRRKRRKFEAEFGTVTIEHHGVDAVELFCTMHRLSHGKKGRFMTEQMQKLFTELLSKAGARIHLLVCDGVPLAAAFGFESETGYFYYNSAYDPGAAMVSPGVVLLSAMIEAEIERGATTFDFLKGDEEYKFRHGAVPRPLFVIEGHVP